MDKNISAYKAKSFVSETNISSIAYEVKRTRAVFDDSLAIPGTNRRGGWRCPPGTRYGGQITDRFGRNCGWGVSRRLANEISDIGERLENVGDRRRGRRAARAERAAGRVQRPGLVERAAGNIARALDTEDNTVDTPKPSRVRKGGARRPNLRLSEERRMEREIENPGAPRTGDVENPPVRRPRPAAPAARRRPAAQQVAREKPKPEVVDAPEAPAPAKKAPVKKAAAKKKAVKKKAPAKKAAARRVTPAAGGNDEPPRMATQRPQTPTPTRPRVDSDNAANSERMREARADRARGAGQEVDLNDALNDINFNEYVVDRVIARGRLGVMNDPENYPVTAAKKRAKFVEAEQRISQAEARLERIEQAINRGDIADNDFITVDGDRVNIAQIKASMRDYRDAWEDVKNANDADNPLEMPSERPETPRPPTPRPQTPEAPPAREATPELPPINGLRPVFAGRQIGFERNWQAERQRILDLDHDFDNLTEDSVIRKISDFDQNLNWNQEYLRNLEALDPNQRIELPNRVVKAGDLKEEVQGVVNAWQDSKDRANARLVALNANRLPGVHGIRAFNGQNFEGHNTIEIARERMDRLSQNYPNYRFNIVNHNGKFYVISQDQLDRAQLNGLDNPRIVEFKGGLPLANELPSIDSDIARQAKDRVDSAIQRRQDILADYLDKRYGAGNAPWKEMTAERRIDLAERAARGDEAAKQELLDWAKKMYSHSEIEGKNGETYRIVARPSLQRGGGYISVSAEIQRKTENGSWIKVGSSERTIHHREEPAWVYNNNMFITEKRSKNAGIQTIYNQHAFMYAQAAGFERFEVSAVDDGPYVWGRIGFTQRIERDNIMNMNKQLSKFRDGESSIIKTDTDARIVEHLIGQWIRNPDNVRHLDFIAALSIEGNAQAKKTREKELRDWFVSNMAFGRGKLNLNDNNISPDPRERVRA